MKRYTQLLVSIGCSAALLVGDPVQAVSTPQSANYRFDETTVGDSGYLDASSTSYKATSATGALGVGSAASSSYQVTSGPRTTIDPTLSFSIPNGSLNFGSFSASSTATTTGTFTVSDYTSYGYTVQIIGTPPTNGSKTIAPMTTTNGPTIGTEQFGINLVANTSPSSVGANPVNDQFGFGTASTNYNTPNQYRFVSGETIAQSLKSSGVTTFTITYMVNVAGLTTGGQYASNQTLLVTGTY